MKISIVIPTYNRVNKLKACLESISHQEEKDGLAEVVVVDDGSTDGTRSYLKESRRNLPFSLIYILADHAGPAAARNKGIDRATGDIVLFMGDDTQAAPNLLRKHLKAHSKSKESISVLGHTTWLSSLAITPFMHFQENGGSQFAYTKIRNTRDCGWNFYYTTNISTPRMILRSFRFDERFTAARFEDMELGYRLDKAGYRIEYHRELMVWHDHPMSFEDFANHSYNFGKYAALFYRIHQNEEIAAMIGIKDAMNATEIFAPGLRIARQTISQIERFMPFYDAKSNKFGERGSYEILAQCYRLLIHASLISGIRAALKLPEPLEE